MRKTTWALIAALAVAGALWTTTASAQSNADKLEISAFAINMSNIATGSNAMVQLTVNAWSTAEERERLITAVLEKGPDALLKELQKTPDKGRFQIPTARQPDPHKLAMGLDLHYAWQSPLPDGGRRIVLATDRYIGFQEARNQPRTIDYPITLIELRVDSSGKGQGKLAYATKISFNKKDNQLEIENYSSEPVRLNNVEVKVKN